jgi:hypothetical protein
VQWKRGKNSKTGELILTPIGKLIDWETRKGRWVFSELFYEMSVMEFWHINSLEDWHNRPEDEKALLIAYYNTKNMMMDYEQHLEELKMSRNK